MAVHPTRQGEGLGALLISESLWRAVERGWTRVILVGDEPYYGRFGFSRATARALDYPPPTNPDRLLARALAPGAVRRGRGDGAALDASARLTQAISGFRERPGLRTGGRKRLSCRPLNPQAGSRLAGETSPAVHRLGRKALLPAEAKPEKEDASHGSA